MPAARPSADQPTTPPCRSGPDRNQLRFCQPRLRYAVSRLPSPFPERSSSAVYIIVGVASRMRSRSLFAGWKPQGRDGNRGPARVGGGQTRRGILSRSITQPTHSKAGSCSCPPAWTPHGLPVLQQHSGQLERRHSGADLVSGTRDAEGISHHHHSPGGPQLIQLTSPSALGLPGGLVPGTRPAPTSLHPRAPPPAYLRYKKFQPLDSG